jgi:hypothetical protein
MIPEYATLAGLAYLILSIVVALILLVRSWWKRS